ncbi:hypothetical protein P7C70_g6033, partial [Phenoliferia sp. Uapishka_3]
MFNPNVDDENQGSTPRALWVPHSPHRSPTRQKAFTRSLENIRIRLRGESGRSDVSEDDLGGDETGLEGFMPAGDRAPSASASASAQPEAIQNSTIPPHRTTEYLTLFTTPTRYRPVQPPDIFMNPPLVSTQRSTAPSHAASQTTSPESDHSDHSFLSPTLNSFQTSTSSTRQKARSSSAHGPAQLATPTAFDQDDEAARKLESFWKKLRKSQRRKYLAGINEVIEDFFDRAEGLRYVSLETPAERLKVENLLARILAPYQWLLRHKGMTRLYTLFFTVAIAWVLKFHFEGEVVKSISGIGGLMKVGQGTGGVLWGELVILLIALSHVNLSEGVVKNELVIDPSGMTEPEKEATLLSTRVSRFFHPMGVGIWARIISGCFFFGFLELLWRKALPPNFIAHTPAFLHQWAEAILFPRNLSREADLLPSRLSQAPSLRQIYTSISTPPVNITELDLRTAALVEAGVADGVNQVIDTFAALLISKENELGTPEGAASFLLQAKVGTHFIHFHFIPPA